MAGAEGAIARVLAAGARVEDDLKTVGFLWTNQVKQLLSQPGSGRVYGNHQASAPGQPPAPDTGQYRASWTFAVMGPDTVAMYPQIAGHPGQLGEWLEYGTSKMQPRPHVRPTNALVTPQIGKAIAAGIEKRERAAA